MNLCCVCVYILRIESANLLLLLLSECVKPMRIFFSLSLANIYIRLSFMHIIKSKHEMMHSMGTVYGNNRKKSFPYYSIPLFLLLFAF